MENWRKGKIGSFIMGLHHGLYCVGCCWVLMLILFVASIMNLLWIAIISIFVFLYRKMSENIVLMGYRGVGKTSVAEYLAKKLGRKVISTDKEIEKKVGKINGFVRNNGWEKFRDIESQVIKHINGDNLIIDCGGGFIERGTNIENLKKNGIIIWLKAPVKTIQNRIKNEERPSLTGASFLDEIEDVSKKRLPLYKKAADYEIDTDNKKIEEIVNEILSKLK